MIDLDYLREVECRMTSGAGDRSGGSVIAAGRTPPRGDIVTIGRWFGSTSALAG